MYANCAKMESLMSLMYTHTPPVALPEHRDFGHQLSSAQLSSAFLVQPPVHCMCTPIQVLTAAEGVRAYPPPPMEGEVSSLHSRP